MATDALRDEAAMRRRQIDGLVAFLADREDLRRATLRTVTSPDDANAEGSEVHAARRHLVLLSDGLATDPLSYYLELVPTAGSLAVEAAGMPGLEPLGRTAAAYGWTAAPVVFAPENDDGVDIRSNDVTVGFTLRFNRPRSGGQQTVEEELALFVQPVDWEGAAAATGGAVLSNGLEIAEWIARLPRRLEARFELPESATAAGPLELRPRDEDRAPPRTRPWFPGRGRRPP